MDRKTWLKLAIPVVTMLLCLAFWWVRFYLVAVEPVELRPSSKADTSAPSENEEPSRSKSVPGNKVKTERHGTAGDLVVRVRTRENTAVAGCIVQVGGEAELVGDVVTETNENRVRELSTDVEGLCKFHDLPLGFYAVTAYLEDWGGSGTAHLTSARRLSEVDIILGPGGILSGKVTTPEGEPCPGARVYPVAHDGFAIPEERFRALSVAADENGVFLIPFIEAQTWDLFAEFPAHRTTGTSGVQVGTSDVRIIMEPAARLAGQVINSETASPVKGMRLVARTAGVPVSARCVTDGEGKFDFSGLVEGEVTLLGYHPTLVLSPSPSIAQARMAESANTILEAKPGAGISGRIVSSDGVGIANIRVGFTGENGGRFVTTDVDGAYIFENVAPGGYVIYTPAAPPGESRAIQVAPNLLARVPDWIVNLKILRGRVLDTSETPVVNAHVSVLKDGPVYEQLTNDHGEFQVAEPGITGVVTVVASKHEVSSDPVTISLNDEAEPDVTLVLDKPRGVVGGKVVDRNGRPVKASLTLSNYEGFPGANSSSIDVGDGPVDSGTSEGVPDAQLVTWDVTANTDSEGYFLAQVDTPADVRVFVAKYSPQGIYDKTLQVEQFSLAAGQARTDLRVVFPSGGDGKISGSVVDEGGAPVPNVDVSLSPDGGGDTVMCTTKIDGQFVAEGLEGETFELSVTHWGYQFVKMAAIRTGSERVLVTLRRPSVLTGYVKDSKTGAPVTSFEIAVIGWQVKNIDQRKFCQVSNADGYFEVEVSAGSALHDMDIEVKALGYENMRQNVGKITPDIGPLRVVIEPTNSKMVGTVVDSAGRPLASARVTARQKLGDSSAGEDTCVSTADGKFEFYGLPVGRYILEAVHAEYAPTSIEVEAPTIDELVVMMSEGGELTGQVGSEGQPVEGVSLRTDSGQVARTDADGRFQLEHVPLGEVHIEMRLPRPDGNSETRTTSATIEEGAVTNLEIDLGPDGASIPE